MGGLGSSSGSSLGGGRSRLGLRGRDRRLGLGEVVLRMGLDKLGEGLERAVTLVVDKGLGTSRLELDGREAGNLEASRCWEVVGGGVHLKAMRHK
jgi:hypothetical protein